MRKAMDLYRCLLYLIIIFSFFSRNIAANDIQPPTLPTWHTLEFEQRAFFAKAASYYRIDRIEPQPDQPELWSILVKNTVQENSEEIFLKYDPGSGRTVTRTRLSHGKDKRYKVFNYNNDNISRERRDPSEDMSGPPQDWEISSVKEIEYPIDAANTVVTNAYTLIALAHELLSKGQTSASVIVHTEFNFYNVEMEASDGFPIDVSYEIVGEGNVLGTKDTNVVKLKVTAINPLAEKREFSLLGLDGYILLFFEKESGILLRLRGKAPRIGTTEINLKRVGLRINEK